VPEPRLPGGALPNKTGIGFGGALGGVAAAIAAGDAVDRVFRAYTNKRYRTPPDLINPERWRVRHGYNDPVSYYPVGYWGGVETYSGNRYLQVGKEGPGTGVIWGQSITPLALPYTGTGTYVGFWVKEATLGRHAQLICLEKLATPALVPMAKAYLDIFGPQVGWMPVGPTVPPLEVPPIIGPMPEPVTDIAGQSAPSGNTGISLSPGQAAKMPPPYRPSRPGRGTKERKPKMDRALKAGLDVLGGWSEFNDLVSSLYYALPKEYQTPSFHNGKPVTPSWRKQWRAVYKNFAHVDIAKAFANYAKSQTADMVIGRFNKAIDKRMPWAKDKSYVSRFLKRNVARQFFGYPF